MTKINFVYLDSTKCTDPCYNLFTEQIMQTLIISFYSPSNQFILHILEKRMIQVFVQFHNVNMQLACLHYLLKQQYQSLYQCQTSNSTCVFRAYLYYDSYSICHIYITLNNSSILQLRSLHNFIAILELNHGLSSQNFAPNCIFCSSCVQLKNSTPILLKTHHLLPVQSSTITCQSCSLFYLNSGFLQCILNYLMRIYSQCQHTSCIQNSLDNICSSYIQKMSLPLFLLAHYLIFLTSYFQYQQYKGCKFLCYCQIVLIFRSQAFCIQN
ncbi:unnamed protein product (macronuclear) [Paramecium tetraurelia]|uniref:Transmembrane protein n=1 Tax=Paramecium tetraurelia TaxID=5888 RepID=A0BM78_PARTE|nr:uncharacterized protein GSPATT00030279001 [Paramecium tetraurelia]CAK59645.1 unnamed protein product [Paramecium tetraurelia]|eukprot:XP_001427043.1 hypothetical protein (macronuclear) [Paramecium tetraurelia strain d4-2]